MTASRKSPIPAVPDRRASNFYNDKPVFDDGDDVRSALHDQLLRLNFHAFEACTRDLLVAMGYRNVEILERAAWRQRTGHGGLDLEASSETGVTRARIILQVKQYTRPVSRRFVDELRGTMLRTGAGHGLVIATSTFAKAARRAATGDHSAQIAPIRLIDGEELLDLLITHHIGVQEEHGTEPEIEPNTDRRFGLDRAYFDDLTNRFPGMDRRKTARSESAKPPVARLCGSDPNPTGGPMTWRTHLLAGLSALWLLNLAPGALSPQNIPPLTVSAAFGALLPDLDAADSKLRSLTIAGIQPVAPVSDLAHRAWGHRGFLHSAAGLLCVTGLSAGVAVLAGAPLLVAGALALGYASHLLLDACTRSGIPLLYPSRHRIHLLPPALRLRTGSQAEEVVLALLLLPALLLLFT